MKRYATAGAALMVLFVTAVSWSVETTWEDSFGEYFNLVLVNNETIAKPQRISLVHLNRFIGDDARIDHPDISRIMPGCLRIVRVVDNGDAD